MIRKRKAARATDAGTFGDPRLEQDLARVRDLLAAATTDPSDAQRATMIFEQVRGEILRTPFHARRTLLGLRAGWRSAVLGFALAASVGGAALVASDRGLEPKAKPASTAEWADELGRGIDGTGPAGGSGPEGDGSSAAPGRDDSEVTAPGPRGGARPGPDAACRSKLVGLEGERVEVLGAYEDELLGSRRDRDEELADLDREIAATTADLDEEIGEIDADYRAQMRELQEEWREADGEDRREIEREMEELREEWDAAVAAVEQDRRAAQRRFADERRTIVAEYGKAIVAAKADRDARLAELDEQEREIRAGCA